MADLSPTAQAVLNAAYALPLKNGQPNIAAALRAAAVYSYCSTDRRILLTIADELEALPND